MWYIYLLSTVVVYNRYVKKGYTTLHKTRRTVAEKPAATNLVPPRSTTSHFSTAVAAKVAFIWAMYGLLNVGIFCVLILFAVNVFLIFARSHPSLANVTLWLCMVFNIQFDNAQAIFFQLQKQNKTTAKSTLNERENVDFNCSCCSVESDSFEAPMAR